MKRVLPIVEGDGDLSAMPVLIRRVAEAAGHHGIQVLKPHKRGDLPKVRSRFDDFLGAALLEQAPILWVMDYDCKECDDVERDLAALVERAKQSHVDQPLEFAFFVKEFESLFLADRETTVAYFPDIPPTTRWPTDPESLRNAKGWLSEARPRGMAYKETMHQVRLAARVDLDRLRHRSSSFQRFEQAVLRLLNA